jgi:hypothetical protein
MTGSVLDVFTSRRRHADLAGEGIVPPKSPVVAYSARNRLLEALAEGEDHW